MTMSKELVRDLILYDKYSTSIVLDEDRDEISITVYYRYFPRFLGSRSSLGVPEEPDQHEGIEIEYMFDQSGRIIEVDDTVCDRIEQEIMKYIREKVR